MELLIRRLSFPFSIRRELLYDLPFIRSVPLVRTFTYKDLVFLLFTKVPGCFSVHTDFVSFVSLIDFHYSTLVIFLLFRNTGEFGDPPEAENKTYSTSLLSQTSSLPCVGL